MRPLPLQQPRGREDLVPAAKRGALRILAAARAAGVARVVMTSSMLAMILKGACPAGPPVGLPVVDVRELAAVQVAAMVPVAGGRRLIAAGET